MTNPWNLAKRQCEVLDALVEHGSNKAIGSLLGITERTAENHLQEIGRRMSITRNRVRMAVTWDRWRRSQEVAA